MLLLSAARGSLHGLTSFTAAVGLPLDLVSTKHLNKSGHMPIQERP